MVTQLQIFRGDNTQAIVKIDESTIFTNEFMGDDKIECSFISAVHLDIQVSDYIEYQNNRYTIAFELPPEETKNDRGDFTYKITFFGPLYDWYKKQVSDEGKRSFPYTDTPVGFMLLIIGCIHELDSTWTLGDIELIDEPQQLQFDKTSCRVALTMVAQAFGLQYYVINKKVYLVKDAGTLINQVTFKYGKGNGLYELTRKPASNGFATVWFGEGGTKNLPENYRGGLTALTFDNNPYVVANTRERYGYKEDTVTFEDVYPQRTAVAITAGKKPGTDNEWFVTDPTLDFDLNGISIPNATKIVFKSGELGGNEFNITSYDHPTRTIYYTLQKEESGYILPNNFVYASAGDKYTLVNIYMPQSYVVAAEALLQQRTIEHALKNGAPKFLYALVIDEHFVRINEYENKLKAGDKIPVADTDLEVGDSLRIQSISWPLVNPAAISATISDEIQYTLAEKITKAIVQTKALGRTTFAVASTARARANESAQIAANAQTAVTNAEIEIAAINIELNNIASDNILSAVEKPAVLRDMQAIVGEVPIIDAQALNYALDRTDYDAKAMALVSYLTPLLSDLTIDSPINGPEFRTYFKAYYDAKITLLKAVSDKAKLLANNAQTTANQAVQDAAAAYLAAGTAKAQADQAIADAATANAQIADITNDNILSPAEKPRVLLDVQVIQSEKPALVTKAQSYGINTASYETAYNDLMTYVQPLIADITVYTVIDGPTFRQKFNAYYTAKIALLNAIYDVANSLASDAYVAADAARLFAQQVGDDVYNSAAYNMFQKTSVSDLAVLSAAFVAGNPISGAIGGINGTAFNPDDVVFWAGADFAGRNNAPYRVTLNGKLYTVAGKIGNWDITQQGIQQIGNNEASIIQIKNLPAGGTAEARVGTNIVGSIAGDPQEMRVVGYFKNSEHNPLGTNVAMYIEASGGQRNIAIDLNGAIRSAGETSVSGDISYQLGNQIYRLKFRNGIYVGNYLVS